MRHELGKTILASALAAALFPLAGCGGGGGDDPAPAPTSAEGLWTGTTQPGATLNMVVLENGEYWGVYSSGGVAYGLLQGRGTSAEGTFTSSDGRDFGFGSTSALPFSVSGKYVAKTSLTGTATYTGAASTFTTTYDAGYETPVTLASLTGSWSGSLGSLDATGAFTMVVAANGSFSANSEGCVVTGTFTPRASGKSVFDVRATYDLSTCGVNHTAAGIAVPGTGGYLTVGLVLPDRSNGLYAVAKKN